MKLHANSAGHLNVFTAYGDNHVMVNQVRHEGSLIVTPLAVSPWRPTAFDDLNADDFATLLGWQPEVVLLGTGARMRFPHPRLTRALLEAHIGVEAMDVSALCRTFNILVAEDRKVLAAVLFA
ncbi:MAG: Mth938-like domain-containing protein [Burkholderiales bacterium]|nr:Mth938-like domain-containing protein [Burkholderiales bacterium]